MPRPWINLAGISPYPTSMISPCDMSNFNRPSKKTGPAEQKIIYR